MPDFSLYFGHTYFLDLFKLINNLSVLVLIDHFHKLWHYENIIALHIND